MHHGVGAFQDACKDVGIKPVQEPFWKHLPFLNIYESITPDVLHQIYQGVLKHVIAWITQALGEAEIDARCRRLPPNHHIRLFMKGITHLSRVTGTEHDQIARFLLGLLMDIQLPHGCSSARLIRAVRGLLDFLNLARYPIHSSQSLAAMDRALQVFHENRDIFIELGVREHFDIPKVHFMGHYRFFIEMYGTTDNFNTENTERLHIDMAKHAYAASNRKDEYAQMTLWLDRQEKIRQHAKYIRRLLDTQRSTPAPHIVKPLPALVPERRQRMTKHPTATVSLQDVRDKYGAADFENALRRFVAQYQNPSCKSKSRLTELSWGVDIRFTNSLFIIDSNLLVTMSTEPTPSPRQLSTPFMSNPLAMTSIRMQFLAVLTLGL